MCELPFEIVAYFDVKLCHIEQVIFVEWTKDLSFMYIVSKQLRKGLEFWKMCILIIGCEFCDKMTSRFRK